MAIGTPVSCGTNAATTAGSTAQTCVVTLTAAIAVGDEITVLCGLTGNKTASSITDTGSNSYSSVKSVNSGSGATDTKASIHRSKCTTALGIGDTVTVTYSGISGGSITAEVVKVTPVVDAADATGSASGDSGDPTGSITTVAESTVAFAVVIQYAGIAPIYDEDASWTSLSGFDYTGHNLSLHTAYQILSSSGSKTYNPETPGTAGEWSMALASFAESASRLDLLPILGVS